MKCQRISISLTHLQHDSLAFSKNTLQVSASSKNSFRTPTMLRHQQWYPLLPLRYDKQCYTIDTNTYCTEHLVDDSLAEYQGPALLVYNNSTFSDKDFVSLKSLGDSQKAMNKLTTGKFGLGFSSVHHPM